MYHKRRIFANFLRGGPCEVITRCSRHPCPFRNLIAIFDASCTSLYAPEPKIAFRTRTEQNRRDRQVVSIEVSDEVSESYATVRAKLRGARGTVLAYKYWSTGRRRARCFAKTNEAAPAAGIFLSFFLFIYFYSQKVG
jgi:hypothetical protein